MADGWEIGRIEYVAIEVDENSIGLSNGLANRLLRGLGIDSQIGRRKYVLIIFPNVVRAQE